jgi:hypothetical protein
MAKTVTIAQYACATLGVGAIAALGEVLKDPVNASLVGATATVVGGIAGNLATRALEAVPGKTIGQFVKRHLTNHDAAKALRKAQLDALSDVVKSYESSGWSDTDEEFGRPALAFAEAAGDFVKQKLSTLEPDLDHIEIRPVVAHLVMAMDSALANSAMDISPSKERLAPAGPPMRRREVRITPSAIWLHFATRSKPLSLTS